jgi:hypothetical protein
MASASDCRKFLARVGVREKRTDIQPYLMLAACSVVEFLDEPLGEGACPFAGAFCLRCQPDRRQNLATPTG